MIGEELDRVAEATHRKFADAFEIDVACTGQGFSAMRCATDTPFG
jgi:hypothetical protein